MDALNPLEHLEWALSLPPAEEFQSLPVCLEAWLDTELALDAPSLAKVRFESLQRWRERKRVLDPLWARELALLPEHVQSVLGPKKNLLLLAEMLQAIQWPDQRLVDDLKQGFPLTGAIPRSGVLPSIPFKECSESASSLRAQASVIKQDTLRRVRRQANPEPSVRKVFMEKCDQEVAEGHARWRSLAGSCILTARFPADEGWKEKRGEWMRKVRCIDDFSASGVNSAASPGEVVRHDTLDRFVAVLCKIMLASADGVALRKEDFVNAFKTLPLASSHLQYAVVTWDSAAAQGQALQLLACPFGATASVYSWERFGAAVRAILAELFLVVYLRFVDDLFGADRAVAEAPHLATPAGASDVARAVVTDLLGWELDPEKRVAQAHSAPVLGVEFAIDKRAQCIRISIPPAKIGNWQQEIRNCLARNCLQPDEARKLAGKLNWGSSAAFGRAGRVHLAPLFRHASGSTSKMSGRVERALRWWLQFLECVPQRLIHCARLVARTRCIVYSDATGHGDVAWAICLPSARFWAASVVPAAVWRWACYRKTQIATWELLAAICALQWLLDQNLGELDVVLFVDNKTALGTLVRGSSRQVDWNALIGDLWLRVARTSTLLSSFYVPSHLNVADAPTRPKEKGAALQAMQEVGFTRVQWRSPSDAPWPQ